MKSRIAYALIQLPKLYGLRNLVAKMFIKTSGLLIPNLNRQ